MVERAVAMAGIGAALLALRWALGRALGRVALGLGDVKLMVAAATWLPAGLIPALVAGAAVTGLVETVALIPSGGRIAFGRHLAPWLWGFALLAPWATPILAPVLAPA
jgi:leader peptidase (prepilin peptidase)/N-methyltransferase